MVVRKSIQDPGALSLGVNLLSREGNSQKWRMKDDFWLNYLRMGLNIGLTPGDSPHSRPLGTDSLEFLIEIPMWLCHSRL
jgi:hypothetical protein